ETVQSSAGCGSRVAESAPPAGPHHLAGCPDSRRGRDGLGHQASSYASSSKSRTCASCDLEIAHHHHVFVLQVVAVEDILAFIAVEAGDDPSLLSWTEIESVFPPAVEPADPLRASPEHLEMDQMQVNGVMELPIEVPDLHLP